MPPLLPLTAVFSVFNFALICYWVPDFHSHHLHPVPVQGDLGGVEAVHGDPEGAELDCSVCLGVERRSMPAHWVVGLAAIVSVKT